VDVHNPPSPAVPSLEDDSNASKRTGDQRAPAGRGFIDEIAPRDKARRSRTWRRSQSAPVMKKNQRQCLQFGHWLLEGRDIGTNVFPETDFKFYLDANLEERTRRRQAEGVAENLAARDEPRQPARARR